MRTRQEGLTATYNDFNDRDASGSEIRTLREHHGMVDRAVLDAYGWTDIQPTSEFVEELEDEDQEDENVRRRGLQRRKRFRYRWPDETQDEVLARLLELNRQRALEEGQVVMDEKAAALDVKMKKFSNGKRNAKKAKKDSTSGLFVMDQEEI